MFQQINLYIPPEKPPEIFLTLGRMLQLCGLVFLILFIISAGVFYSHYRTEQELAELKAQQAKKIESLSKAQRRVPTEAEREQLRKKIAALGKLKASKETMFATLSKLQYSDTPGFSNYLRSLSRNTLAGLWFTRINFSSGGSLLTFEGLASSADSVPELIQNLGTDTIFKDRTFENFTLTADESDNSRIHFLLSSG